MPKQPSRKATKKPVSRTRPARRASSPRSPRSPISPLSVPVLGTDGKPTGKLALPAALFAAKINKPLMAQAVRVYLANQREGSASTKTRGQVEGSTRKIYRQKGTGRARHGGIRAPIFVGGGIVFGPKPRDYHLDLPKKMKRAALASALTSQREAGNVVVVDGLAGLSAKTNVMAQSLRAIVGDMTHRLLLVVNKGSDTVIRSARNIKGVDILPVQNLHTYSVVSHQKLVFMKEAITQLSSPPTRGSSV
ncbi:50S ribosomal protein L4 [Candidatus Gottesmanbacteria bacterium]|nr:50S ribosomal protein L4 [Candidatus Gottesmanbacteria bacterium]